jgi:hypothetical protein
MRAPSFVGVALIIAGLRSGVLASGDVGRSPARQWAVVYLAEPTFIGSTFVQGPVLFTHDSVRMARGEPCTSVQLFEPGRGPIEEIASFHCIPRPAGRTTRFKLTTRPSTIGFGCVLTAYQFADDSEMHGVPETADAH